MLSKKAMASGAALADGLSRYEGGGWGLASPGAGVDLDAHATNATYTEATQLTHRRVLVVVG